MRIVVGSDMPSPTVEHIVGYLREKGHTVELVGALRPGDERLWPYVGYTVARKVVDGEADTGIVCCWTGTGVAIAANKVRGARAALCLDAETARGARLWDDANILALSLRSTSTPIAQEIVDAWLSPPAEEKRDAEDRRGLELMKDIEALAFGGTT